MSDPRPKATSVLEDGEPDGFAIGTGFWAEKDWHGVTRLVVSVPPERLAAVHAALLGVLGGPVGVLWRQVVDRRAGPPAEGAPPRDFVALEVPAEHLAGALSAAADLVFHDARGELWVRGRQGDQVVLDGDGLLYCYPDDPAFRDALEASAVPEGKVETLQDRDYVKHWFRAECDVLEDALIVELGLIEMAPQKQR